MPGDQLAALARELGASLPPNDAAFLRRVYSDGLERYAQRLSAAGMTGRTRVLDAGCGFGQWSLALAETNARVDALDRSPERLGVLEALARHTGARNITPRLGTIDETGYPDNSFDRVFCYGVLFLTPWRESLRELHRVLAPGGMLYVNANAFGWCRHLWHTAHNAAEDYDPRHYAAQTLTRTWRYNNGHGPDGEGDILIEPDQLHEALVHTGFAHIVQGAEGTLTHPGYAGPAPTSFFHGEYGSDTGVHEALAVKAQEAGHVA